MLITSRDYLGASLKRCIEVTSTLWPQDMTLVLEIETTSVTEHTKPEVEKHQFDNVSPLGRHDDLSLH